MTRRTTRRAAGLAAAVAGLLLTSAAPAAAGQTTACAAGARADFARVQLYRDANCGGPSVIVKAEGDGNRPDFARFRNFDGTLRSVDNTRSSLAIAPQTCVRLFDGKGYGGQQSTPICAGGGVLFWNLDRFNDRASSMKVCAADRQADCGAGAAPAPAPQPGPTPPAPSPGATANATKVLSWARRHVDWWKGLYSMDRRLPIVSVSEMQRTEPPRGRGTPSNVRQGCDCSSYVRWAMAQAGVDIGTFTGNIWTANGALGARKPTNANATTKYGAVARGWGNLPPGGYRPGDLLF